MQMRMNLEQALAVYLYTKDNIVAWVEPGKGAKQEAWEVICEVAKDVIESRYQVAREPAEAEEP